MLEKVAAICYIFVMGKRFFLVRVLFALIFTAVFAFPADAQGFFGKVSWLVEGSVLFFPEDNGMDSDPMPVLPSLGLGASYEAVKASKLGFSLELTLNFYMTHYGYSDELGRAVPNAIENRTARVIGFLMGIHAVGFYDVNSFMTARVYAGPAADLRAVIMAAGLNEGLDDLAAIRKDVDSVRNYFWSKGRWFMPVAGAGLDFAVNETFKLGLDFRVWMPIYRLWTGEDLPAIEGWRFGMGFRLTIR